MTTFGVPGIYGKEAKQIEGPVRRTTTGVGGMLAVTKKGPPGVPLRTRNFQSWQKLFGGYEAASRGDAAYEAKMFFDEGGSELVTVRQVNYTDLDDKTTFSGGVSNRTVMTDGVAATAASKRGAVGTYKVTPGASFDLDVDNGGPSTVTFDAAAGYIIDTTTYPVADQDGLNMTVTLDGGSAQTITFSGATTTAQSIINQINSQLDGGYAVDDGTGQVKIVSDKKGTGSSVAVGTGTSGLTWAAATAGTGDVVDSDAITATEVKTVVEADTTGCTVTVNADGSFTIASDTTGTSSELDFQSGTALTPLGLSVEVVAGTASGATYDTLKFEAGYRGRRSPGVAGNDLKVKITQNPKQASAGAGSCIAADITAADTSVQVLSLKGINAKSVIKVWDGTNTEYKEVTGVRTVVSGATVTFFVDISGTFTNSYLATAAQLQTQEFDVQIYENDVLIDETWSQMSMLDTAENYVESLMNDENLGSSYVYVTDLDAAAGLGADLPATDSSATALTGGTDEILGMTDADWVGTATGKTGIYAFDTILDYMPICTPGNNSSVLAHAMKAYSISKLWKFYVSYVSIGTSAVNAVAYRNTTLGIDSSYMALYAGGVKVFDPNGTGSNPKRSISGVGGIMGLMCRVDSQVGPWESPAGEGDFGELRTALDVATEYSSDDHGSMNLAGVNVLRKFTNTSPVLVWGSRTCDASTQKKFLSISVRRFFQFVEKSVVDDTRWAVFRNNNYILWGKLKDRINTFLNGLLIDEAFPTNVASEAYQVLIGIADGTMDQSDIDALICRGKVRMAPQKPAEFYEFTFAQMERAIELVEAA